MPLSPARFGEPPKAWLYPSRVGRFEGSAQHHLNVPRRTPHFNLCCPTRRRSFNLQKVAVRFGGKTRFCLPMAGAFWCLLWWRWRNAQPSDVGPQVIYWEGWILPKRRLSSPGFDPFRPENQPWRLTKNSKTCLDSQVFFWDWDLAMFSLFWLFRHVPSLPTQRFQDVSSLISLLIFTKLHGQLRYDLLRYIGHESTLDEAGIWGCRWIMSMGCGSTGCQIFYM